MSKIPTFDEMAKDLAKKALDEFLYKGKTLREWVEIIISYDWVSIKDRMPIDGSDVLFCDMDGDIYIGHHIGAEPRTHFVENGSWETIKNVVAWKELPTPYVESEE
jgi:hypothetical protein